MKTRTSTWLWLAMALAGNGLLGCGDGASAAGARVAPASDACAANGPTAKAETKVHTFLDASGAQSRVVRLVRPDGSETMTGETRAPSAASVAATEAAAQLPAGGVLREYAEIDASGRLVYADVSLRDATGIVQRMIVDPQRRAVLLRRAGGKAGFIRVPGGAPWIYAPMGRMVTPVAAWITRRAAQAAPEVRLIDADSAESFSVASDQLLFQEGSETFVVLGDSAVSADDDFITSLPLSAVTPSLARAAGDDRAPDADQHSRPG